VIIIAGGGLAGCEAAWQLAERRHNVVIREMRPVRATPAHQTDRLAELVCSNTFKSTELSNAHGLLKAEMRALGSLILECADEARVPAGSALGVDRDAFAAAVTARMQAHPRIAVERGEMTELPSPGIVATGPLTSDALTRRIAERLGTDSLAFYDAIAPIVAGMTRSIIPSFSARRGTARRRWKGPAMRARISTARSRARNTRRCSTR
jgi:methylenetetrahydrofolate--tRNA-(uracil-5-)-methyltransferase